MAFEEEFGSEISDSEAEKILTVGDAIKFIESKSIKAIKLSLNEQSVEQAFDACAIITFGAGKTTLSKKIQQSDNSFEISVSHTTRKPRPNEVDGLDYHFVSKEHFKSLIKQNSFYEHAEIFGNFYGTTKSSIKKITQKK